MKKPTARTIVQQGFSLVELLVVIAVIAVIAAIAIPNIANITGAAGEAKNQRNAQNIANLTSAARAAGHASNYTTPTAWAEALKTGVSGSGSTSLNATIFRIDSLSAVDQSNALSLLAISPTGGGTNSVLVLSNQ